MHLRFYMAFLCFATRLPCGSNIESKGKHICISDFTRLFSVSPRFRQGHLWQKSDATNATEAHLAHLSGELFGSATRNQGQ